MKTTSRNPDSVSSENMTPEEARSERTIFMTPIESASLEVVEALVDAVVDGTVDEQAGEAAPAGVEQARVALDVQVGLVLAGEARGREVLGGGRAAHGQADVLAVLRLQLPVSPEDLVDQSSGIRRRRRSPGPASPAGQVGDVRRRGRPSASWSGAQAPGPSSMWRYASAVMAKPFGTRTPCAARLLVHLAQRRVLTADQSNVLNTDLPEEPYVARGVHDPIIEQDARRR